METEQRWITSNLGAGIIEIELSSWKYFSIFVNEVMPQPNIYIWRGQRCDYWKLEPTLDRVLKKQDKVDSFSTRWKHLDNFKNSTRGRRGTNPIELKSENEWWALGQHQGLATPLLDWSRSPFVAAFFAFIEEGDNSCDKRAIWALSQVSVCSKSYLIETNTPEGYEKLVTDLIDPVLHDNPRQVSQSGLFTRSPDGVDMESWISKNFIGEEGVGVLIKFTVPEVDRNFVLKSLNRMNINPLMLFPDLYGTSLHTNLELQIDRY